MGSNAFSKQEIVDFTDFVIKAEDALDAAGLIKTKNMPLEEQQRSNDTMWMPRHQIQTSHDGLDVSDKFAGKVQLSVPVRVNNMKTATFELDGLELRDAMQEKDLFAGSTEKLASDINLSVIDVLNRWGSLAVMKSGAASGFNDLADVATLLDQNGVKPGDRVCLLNPRDYRGMASDLSKADRSLIGDISTRALRQAFVGELAGINTYRQQYTRNQSAQTATPTISTLAASSNNYVPRSTSTDGDGILNVDSRKQQVTLSSNTGLVAGDRFTIDDVENVHPITKESTGELKTFVIVEIVAGSATDVVISPPLITAQGGSEGEKQYQNCEVTSPSGTAAVNFINTVAAPQNYFFHRDAVVLVPSQIVLPSDAGMAITKLTGPKSGITFVAAKQGQIGPGKVQYRVTARWGVTVTAPEMVGSLAFGQT